jgi:sugar phosphate isomerase/epimerase
VRRLGPKIVSCHFKDVVLQKELTVRLVECRAGTGGLDYPALLSALQGLDADLPVLMEHLTKAEEYDAAAQFIRSRAEALKIGL